VSETLPPQTNQVWWFMLIISATQEAQTGGPLCETGLGSMRSCLKTNEKQKKNGGMAQVIKPLPSKHEALSSNPMVTKEK
jgi:hypothetical protein